MPTLRLGQLKPRERKSYLVPVGATGTQDFSYITCCLCRCRVARTQARHSSRGVDVLSSVLASELKAHPVCGKAGLSHLDFKPLGTRKKGKSILCDSA